MKFSNMYMVAILALVASVNAEATSASDCQIDYYRVIVDLALTTAQKCEALVVFSKCLGQFPADDAKEAVLYEQNSELCAPIWDNVEAPSVRTARASMQLSVDNAKDIEFFRHRRESVSVFKMNEKITGLLSTVDDLKQQLVDQKKESEESAAATAKDLQDSVAATAKDLQDALDAKSAGLDKKSAELETKLTNGLNTLEDKVDKSVTDTEAALDKSKKDAAIAAVALEKKISGSVTDKLKPFEGTEVALTSLKKTYHSNPKIPVYRVARFHTYQINFGWFDGNSDTSYGGVHPSHWTDGNRRADNMNADVKYLQRIFTEKETANKYGANICSVAFGQRTSTNGLVCMALFRIKNTGTRTIRWSPAITMTSWHGWAESASISVNGNNLIGAKDCNHMCRFTPSLDIPANSQKDRISTAIFASTSSYANGHYNQWRATLLLFRDNSLALPNGLEFVEDLDTMTGSWKQ